MEAVLKRIKKNHIIITALAIMIAAAGYINYAGDLNNIIKMQRNQLLTSLRSLKTVQIKRQL